MFIENNGRSVDRIACVLIGEAMLAVLLYCFSDGISGNDFWWHVKVGEWIVTHGSVPATDIFSWIGQQHHISWTAHEWLSEVLLYLIYSSCGQVGIYLLSMGLAALMTLLLVLQVGERVTKNILISGLFFILFTVLTSLFFYGRPQIFSFFLLFAELKILYGYMEDASAGSVFFSPLIACLWSNLHGGSACLSYMLCALFLIASAFRFRLGRIYSGRKTKGQVCKLLLVTVLSVAGIMVNPIGYRALIYPYVNVSNALQMSVISEWQVPDAKNIGHLILYFLPIVLMSAGFFTETKKIRLIDLMMMGFFVLLFMRSSRFIILWYIAAAFYAFDYLPACRMKELTKRFEKGFCVLGILLLLVPIGSGIYEIYMKAASGQMISTALSEEMTACIKEAEPQRIFNDYNVGETLIYHDIPVFFDARADLYAAEHIFEDGISLLFLEQCNTERKGEFVNPEELIEQYGFDGYVVLKSRPLYAYMMSHPERYELVLEDETTGYLVNR